MIADLAQVLIANSAVALLLGVAAWLVARHGRYPSLAHALYLLALLKLVMPPLLAVPTFAPAAAPVSVSRPVTTPAPAPAVSMPVVASAPVAAQASPVPPPIDGQTVLLAAWALGSAVVLLVMLRRALAFGAGVRSPRPAPDTWTREAHALLPLVGLRRLPALDVVRADIPPLVYPTRRGLRILLPEALMARLTAAQRTSLILHELAHVRRGDPWVRLFEVAVVAILWWHPLAWWLRAGLRDAEEKSCDAWVTAQLPDSRRSYADALLAVAETPSPTTRSIPAHATGAVHLLSWKRRLRSIMSTHVRHRMGCPAGTAVLVLAAVVLPALPTTAQDPEPTSSEQANHQLWRRLETTQVQLRFEDAPLAAWTKSLSTATEIPFVVTDRARALDADKTRLADLALPKMSARRALDVIAKVIDVRWRVTEDRSIAIDAMSPAIQILGAVPRPGWIECRPGRDTVLELATKSGWNDDADIERVMVMRPDRTNPMTLTLDLLRMIQTGDTTYNVLVGENDLIVVPRKRGAGAPVPKTKPEHVLPGHSVVFHLEPSVLKQPGYELLAVLTEPQVVGRGGEIVVPYVGRMVVVGLTERELEALVSKELQKLYATKIHLVARVSWWRGRGGKGS